MGFRPCLAAFLLAAAAAALWAQDGAAAGGPEPPRDFFYRLDPGGKPIFTQLLSWENDPNVLEFQIIVRDASGAVVIDDRLSEARREVRLSPGSYTYRVIAYNLLGKAESETEWTAIEVVKAEQPAITSSSPRTIYMDTFDNRVTVVGENLLGEGSIVLVDAAGTAYVGTIVSRKGDTEAIVVFPKEAYRSGTYSIRVENPGGLSAVAKDALTIRFQRPVGILLSFGYAPLMAISDDWFVEKWSSAFHPLGLSARLGVFFIKKNWGSLGIELAAEGHRFSGGESGAEFMSDFIFGGVDVMYKKRFTRQLHGVARLGGGISWSRHSFDYGGFSGPDTTSYDPFVRAGLSLQAFLPCKLYGEIGADSSWLFLIDHNAIGLAPKLCVGYQIY